MSAPFDIIITVNYGLNICLSNQLPHYLKSFSHFTNVEYAAFFADTLEYTLQTAAYTDRDQCFCCGRPLSKADRLYGLGQGKYAHPRCFFNCYYKGKDDKVPPYTCVEPEPAFDKNAKDFSNLESRLRYGEFGFSIEAVSKERIHLCLRDGNNARKNNFYLSYDQCMEMIVEIRKKLKALADSVIGRCCHCEKTIHADQDSLVLMDGALLHRSCLEKFILSSKASMAQFPAILIQGRNVFGRAYFRK